MSARASAWMLVAGLLAAVDLVLVVAVAAWRRAMRRHVDELDEWADMMARRAARAEQEVRNLKGIKDK